jgi:FkbM family methyltransferase
MKTKVDLGIRHPADAVRRVARAAGEIRTEVAWGLTACANWRSRLRYGFDVLMYRALAFVDLGASRVREIRLRDGTTLTYRLNRGDIRLIAEIFGLEIYRLPPGFDRLTVVDLGANVGFATTFLAARYGVSYALAVEPSGGSASVARLNLARNRIHGEVLQCAVGAEDGVGYYAEDEKVPSQGTMGSDGQPVTVLSMPTLLQRLPEGADVDVLKLDVEGAEAAIFAAEDLSWLERVRLIAIELHPTLHPIEPVVERLRNHGFSYVPQDLHPESWLFDNVMALFVRPSEEFSPLEIPGAAARSSTDLSSAA